MNTLKACGKMLRALLHILSGFLTIVFVFPRLSQEKREQRTQAWSLAMLDRLRITVIVKGQPAVSGPVMLVANHMSWLDITVIHAARFCRFVSKSDVRRWPFIGRLASGIGTLFVERKSRRDAMRVVHHMSSSLRSGDVLGIFPEGTTSDGTTLLPFHANLFEAAIAANAPVQPVALQFIELATGKPSLAPCYIHDDTLPGSVWRTLMTPGIAVKITFGAVQWAEGRSRRDWAEAVRADIAALRQ